MRDDGLRLQLSGVDVPSLTALGTLPGVVILAAAAANGPGKGMIVANGFGGMQLAWQAPGRLTPGIPQSCAADGVYLLEDRVDPAKWIRIQVYASYLQASGGAVIDLSDRYGGVGIDDVAASDAAAGITETVEYTLKNVTANALVNVNLWISLNVDRLSVSGDGSTFVTPHTRSDPAALTWSSIAPGASVNVWLRRTIPAAAVSSPAVLASLEWAWQGIA